MYGTVARWRVKDGKNPERMRNPKKVLNRLFQRHTGKPYVDRWHARQIVARLPDLARLRLFDGRPSASSGQPS